MLNRRYLRVKVLQALYAFFQTEGADLPRGEKEMLKSIEKIYDLYLYMLLLVIDVWGAGQKQIEQNKEKRLPSEEDLNPNTRFVDNRVIRILADNHELLKVFDQKKLTWHPEFENVRKLFRSIRDSDEYERYMGQPDSSFEIDRNFVVDIFRKYIGQFELAHHYLEEKSIYWADDLGLVALQIIKSLQAVKPTDNINSSLLPDLYKDRNEDVQFVKDLFRKTIIHSDEYGALISGHTKNWDMERIAKLDVILMKMAVCEFSQFSSIPVKVSLNEYIELSKSYSTPKSKVFINGVLDKLVAQMKRSGDIVKRGRGLIE